VSKAVIGRAENEFERRLKEIILDPKDLAENLRVLKTIKDGGTLGEKAMKAIVGWMERAGPAMARGTLVGGSAGTDETLEPTNE
jgi:hypothetical protein